MSSAAPDHPFTRHSVQANAADAVPRSCCGQEEQNPSPKPEPIEQLLTQLRGAFDAEKAAGYVIDNQQDPASYTRLNNKVQELLKVRTGVRGSEEGGRRTVVRPRGVVRPRFQHLDPLGLGIRHRLQTRTTGS